MRQCGKRFSDWLLKDLEARLASQAAPFETTMVDLGSNFYANATLYTQCRVAGANRCRTKPDRIHVALGYGFVAEMTRAEAAAFCTKKIAVIQKRRALQQDKAEAIEGHIRELLLGVAELKASVEA